jgi:hypothetical protein
VLSVWGPIERSPGFAVLADGLTRHVSPAAGGLIASGPFGLGDAEEPRALITSAGFKDITVRSAVKTLHYPSPDESVLGYVASSPLASAVGGAHHRCITPKSNQTFATRQQCLEAAGRVMGAQAATCKPHRIFVQ